MLATSLMAAQVELIPAPFALECCLCLGISGVYNSFKFYY